MFWVLLTLFFVAIVAVGIYLAHRLGAGRSK